MNKTLTKSLKLFDEFINSEEGKKAVDDFCAKIDRENDTLKQQLERFHEKYSSRLPELVEHIISKYDSDEYYKRWISRGFEPPRELYWFLFEYAKRYGRECSGKEHKLYGNIFVSSNMWFISGYYFMRMDGQGSVIKIVKQNDTI